MGLRHGGVKGGGIVTAADTGTTTAREPAAGAAAPAGRVLSIDVGRGFALVCMVLAHFTIFYSTEASADSFIPFFFEYMLAGWGAGAFLMMMGMSQALSAR